MSIWTNVDPHIAPELGRSALVVIDSQRDFVDGGASPVPGTTQVLPAIATLVQAYREAGRPIVHIVRLYDGEDVDLSRRSLIASGAPIVRPHTSGSQIVPDLLPPGAPELDPEVLLDGAAQTLGEKEWAIWKPRWGAFHRTALDEHLRGLDVTTIVLAGCNYPNCPRATAYGGSERDYRVLVVADAVSGVRPDHLEEAGRIGVLAATTAEVTSELAATVAIAG